MEGVLKAQIEELNRCRSDYSTLFKNFKHARVVFDEKDQEKSNQLHLALKKVDSQQRKIDEYKRIIAVQKSARGGFANDVTQLKYATDLLEMREKCIWDKHEVISAQNGELNNDVKLQCEIIQRQLAEIGKLNKVLSDESVSKINFDRLVSEMDEMRALMQREMISLDTHQQIKVKYADLQYRVKWEMIALEEYNTIAAEAQSLKTKLQGCVPADDFIQLQGNLQFLQEEIESISANVDRITGGRDDALRALLEEQSKHKALEGHIKKIERELNASTIRENEMIAEIQRIRDEFKAADDNRKLTLQNYILLEAANSALSSNLDTTRQQLDEEIAARTKLEDSMNFLIEKFEYEKTELQEELQCLQKSYVQEAESCAVKSELESTKQKEALDAVNLLHSAELDSLHERFNQQLIGFYGDREATRQVSEAHHNEQILALQEGERSRVQALSLAHQASLATCIQEHKQFIDSIELRHSNEMTSIAIEHERSVESLERELNDKHHHELKDLQATLQIHITSVQEQCDNLLQQRKKEEINVDLERIRADGAVEELLTAKRIILEMSVKLEEEREERNYQDRLREDQMKVDAQNAKILLEEEKLKKLRENEVEVELTKQREIERKAEIERERKQSKELENIREMQWTKNRDERDRDVENRREIERKRQAEIALENEREKEKYRELERELEREKYRKLERERDIERQSETERAKDREMERELEMQRTKERESERDRERSREKERERDREQERVRVHDRERDREIMEKDREKEREKDRKIESEREYDRKAHVEKVNSLLQEQKSLQENIGIVEKKALAQEMINTGRSVTKPTVSRSIDRSYNQNGSSERGLIFDDDIGLRMGESNFKDDAQLVDIARSLEGCSFAQLINIAARGLMMEEAGSTPDRPRRSPSSQAGGRYSQNQIQSPASTSLVGSLLNASYSTESPMSRAQTLDSHTLSDQLHFTDKRSPPPPISSDPEVSVHPTFTAVEEFRLQKIRSSSPFEQRGYNDNGSHHSSVRRVSDSPNTARKASPNSRKNRTSLGPSVSESSPSISISSPPVTPAPPYRRSVGVSTNSKPTSSILESDDLQRGWTVDKPKSTVTASGSELVPPSPSRQELLDRLINLSKEARGTSAGAKNFIFTSPL